MRLPWLLALAFALPGVAAAQPAQVKPLVVTTDEAYPPYYFRDVTGRAQGIVVDRWALWSERTGLPVRVEGREWSRAQAGMQEGSAQVIDPITRTPAREPLYDFSAPYGDSHASVYFRKSISGINDVASLRGFALGAKTGSACARWLSERGVEPRWLYPDAESLVAAAGRGEFVLFCSDVASANYYLHKLGLAGDFREAPPLYTAQYHWAVPKGRTDLHKLVADGFARISPDELRKIDERWMGKPVSAYFDSATLYMIAAAIAAIMVFSTLMIAWNRSLRSRVAERTADLTRALDAVRDNAAKVEDLYNHAPCGYHSLDGEGRVVQINDTELGWLQRQRDEVIGHSLADFLSDGSREIFAARLADFLSSGSARDVEYDLRRKDGTLLSVLISTSALRDASGAFVMTRSTVYDISERKRADEAIRRMNIELEARVKERTRELENANRELESFSYTVSHDLRAPLRHIVAYLSMLEEELREQIGDESRRHLDTARKAARRLDDLIYSLLDFSRLGRAALHHEPVRAGDVVAESRAAIALEAGGREIDWKLDELPDVVADRALLRQVFSNLLSNAVKYTRRREHAEITVGTGADGVTPDEVAFYVSDNGVGFDMKHAGKLFGVFQRLHSEREFEGNGIGLAIVSQIVQRHGGRVWAKSVPDRGTTVYFTLPRNPERATRPRSSRP